MRKPITTLVLVATILVAACSMSARDRAINTAMSTADAARSTFNAWDIAHQRSFEHQGNEAKERADVAAWRITQLKVKDLFIGVYAAIGAAATVNSGPSLDSIVVAGQKLYDELHKLGVL